MTAPPVASVCVAVYHWEERLAQGPESTLTQRTCGGGSVLPSGPSSNWPEIESIAGILRAAITQADTLRGQPDGQHSD
jgi:hypothetical protein